MTVSYTQFFRFGIPDFNTAPWHADFDAVVRQIDRVLYQVATVSITTIWANSTAYIPGNVVIDALTGSMYICQVAHTSAATPTTFAADRVAHPTFWNSFVISAADQVVFMPAGSLVSTNVQDAIEEVQGNVDTNLGTIALRVIGPATNTDNFVPQWDGTDSNTLKDGLAVGTGANQLVQLDGTSKLPAVDGSQLTGLTVTSVGSVINSAYAQLTTFTALSVVLPLDDTIPQNTEGTQILSKAITLSSASNKVRIRVVAFGFTSASYGTGALFRTGQANAINTAPLAPGAASNFFQSLVMEHEDSPATAGSVTYTVRVGTHDGGAMTINGNNIARVWGGSGHASITLEEIKG